MTENDWRAPATKPQPKQKILETTDKQDSFVTVPEIMKPLEHFINAVLKWREAEVTINMTLTSTSNTKDNIMNIDEPKKKGWT